jgi:hypothetical protein
MASSARRQCARKTTAALLLLLTALLLSAIVNVDAQTAVKIACVGDSHTEDGKWRGMLTETFARERIAAQFVGGAVDNSAYRLAHESYFGAPVGAFLDAFPAAWPGAGGVYTHRTGKKSPLWPPGVQTSIATTQPDIITLLLGANDCIFKMPIESSWQAYERLITRLYTDSPTSSLILVTVPPLVDNCSTCVWGSLAVAQVVAWNTRVKGLYADLKAAGRKIFLCDLYPSLSVALLPAAGFWVQAEYVHIS